MALHGEITTLYIANCGQCDAEPLRLDMAWDKKSAERVLRRLGWKHTKAHGWVCSECADKPR